MNENFVTSTAKKPQKRQLNTIIVILCIVLFACLLTWIIPAGEYSRYENESGVMVVDPTTFHYVERSAVNPLMIPMYIVRSIQSNIDMIFMVVASGAAFGVITDSGAIHSSIGAVAIKYKSRKKIFVISIFWLMSVICITQGLTSFLGFVPVILLICRSVGLDSITACAVMLFGSGVGFSCGMLQPSSTLIAQKFAELPPYSGLWLRTVAFVLFLLLTTVLLLRYVDKITKNPHLSPSYEIDQQNTEFADPEAIQAYGPMTVRKWLVIISLIVALGVMAYGCITMGWSFNEIAAIFVALGIVAGIFAGMHPNDIVNSFVKGAKGMMSVFFLLAAARSIALVLSDGKILDTVVYGLGIALTAMPSYLRGIAMFIANLIINFGIPSGSGQAAAVMPIMIPLADLSDLTRQTAVLAFNFGDGFCNMITPTASNLVTVLGLAKVPYEKWMKFMLPIFAWWFVLACVLVVFAQIINYGPF